MIKAYPLRDDLSPDALTEGLGNSWVSSLWPQLPTEPFPNLVMVADELDSTQDRLDEKLLASLPPEVESLLLVTEKQTAGHGREGRSWFAPEGSSLAFSLAIKVRKERPLGHWPLLVGWAKARSLSSWIPFRDLDLKWPNDLLLKGKKISGSLCSFHRLGDASWIKVGIGVNVGAMDFPPELSTQATTLFDHTEPPPARESVLCGLVDSLLEDAHSLKGDDLLRLYARASSIVHNTSISWIENGVEHRGRTNGMDESGALLCEEKGTLRPLHVSEVRQLRPEEL